VGVWLTQDKYRGDSFHPKTLTRYQYVANNPINITDIYGFFWEELGNWFQGKGWKSNEDVEKDRKEAEEKAKNEREKKAKNIEREEAPSDKQDYVLSDAQPRDYSLQGRQFNDEEEELIKKHPFKVYALKDTPGLAESETFDRFGYQGEDDKSDAFRHAYWNALMAKRKGKDFAEDLATAHEVSSDRYLPKEMDLHNNKIGREIGEIYKDRSDSEIADAIMLQLNNGKLWYIDNGQLKNTDK
jgi:hypothetical protein